MAKKTKWNKKPSVCPQCGERLKRDVKVLGSHFYKTHGRPPTSGEYSQFKTYRNTSTPYSDTDFFKPKSEISGGGFSPK
jgi:hypothetical protein